ncbi:hypothetical protein [Halostagnicola sp. A56]|uniref:DUF7344 domain-containing protein n=1 Tax=Halostagnicola sp. A56 TaxID=1495067 RepID=UPI0012E316E4|nr:hypothetical protein [Halostagnicola sp. A56]
MEVLANPRRWMFLQALGSRDDPVYLSHLVDEVMKLEDGDWDDCTKYRNSVRVSLRQNHIKILEEENIIDYNEEEDCIERGDEFYRIKPILDSLTEDNSQPKPEPPDSPVSLEYSEPELPNEDQHNQHDLKSLLILCSILVALVVIACTAIIYFAI